MFRRRFYVDPEIQFPMIVGLLAVTTLVGFFLGWGVYKAIAVAKDWQRTGQVADFFLVLLGVIVPAVGANLAFGTYLSNKLAGPLYKIRQAIEEVTRGNLEAEVSIRKGDLLQGTAVDFNRMVQTLRRMLYRDRRHSDEVNEILSQCQAWLEARTEVPEPERRRLGKLINDAKARLSIINTHFLKAREASEDRS